jgi:hypothetical protein
MGCYDYSKFDNISFEPISPSFVFPLINDTITIQNILEQSDSISLIQENLDHSFSILFRDTIDAGFATDQFSIPDQVFVESFTVPSILPTSSLPLGIFGPFTSEFNENIETTTEAADTVELKRIDFLSGTLQIRLTNTFQHSVNVNLTMTSLIDNLGDTLKIIIPLTSAGTPDALYDSSINLANYYFDCYDITADVYNNFSYKLSASIESSGGPISAGDNVDIRVSVTNTAFERITGKIDYSFDQANQSFNTEFAQSTLDIEQHLEDPKIKFQFINTYGIPMSVTFPQFQLDNADNTPFNLVTSTNNDGDLQIGSGIANVITPITTIGQQPVISNFVLNRDNSNIENAFDVAPTAINFGASFSVGDDDPKAHDYFVDQASTVKLVSEIEIPIYGYVSMSLSDTLVLELTDLDSLDGLDVDEANITLTLRISNQIPFSIYLQAFFIDTLTNIKHAELFDGVADEQIIASPEVGADGISILPAAYKKTDITITKAKYEQMSKANIMRLEFRFALGTETQSAKILSTNSMAIQASIMVSGTMKPNL